MAIVTGKDAAVYATSSPSISITDQDTTASADNLTYTITNQAYRYWDPAVAVVVKANNVVVSPSKIQYCGGKVVFATVPALPVKVSCNYFPYSKVGGAHSATMTLEREMIKDTRLGDSCQRMLPGPAKATISLEQFWVDPAFFNAVTGGTLLGLAFHAAGSYFANYTTGGPRYECYGYIKSDGLKLEAGNVMNETVGFESTGDIYFSPT